MAESGVAAGVPYVALPPRGGARPDAPAVVAWHLLDAPRTETAFAAAVPLNDLDAWRVYFGLPLSGSRTPAGGADEIRRRAMTDAVLELYRPVAAGAADEFPAALAAIRAELGIADGPIGLMGGSMGSLAAQLALVGGAADVRAAVLVSPVVRVRDTIDALAAVHGMTYPWSPASSAFAAQADFVARAGEVAGTPVLVITGEQDLRDAFLTPAQAYVAELRRLGSTADLVVVPGMGHALAEEPGAEPAPQTAHAAEVDRRATAWFASHLVEQAGVREP